MRSVPRHKRLSLVFVSCLVLAFTLSCSGGGGDGGPTVQATSSSSYTVSTLTLRGEALNNPPGLSLDSLQQHVFIANTGANKVLQVALAGLSSTSILGGGGTDYGGCGTNSQLHSPYGLAHDALNNLFITEGGQPKVGKLNCPVYEAYGDTALSHPMGLAVDTSNRVFVSDIGTSKIYSLTDNAGTGVTATVAGGGVGYTNSAGGAPSFDSPYAIVVNSAGVTYVADTNNCAIRKISGGVVTTFAGGYPLSCGYADGVGTSARFDHPKGIAIDASGNLYVADTNNNRIRLIRTDGTVSTIAGTGTLSSPPADGVGTSAVINAPVGIAVKSDGSTVFVTDTTNSLLRTLSH